jgi:hypothetical protein
VLPSRSNQAGAAEDLIEEAIHCQVGEPARLVARTDGAFQTGRQIRRSRKCAPTRRSSMSLTMTGRRRLAIVGQRLAEPGRCRSSLAQDRQHGPAVDAWDASNS